MKISCWGHIDHSVITTKGGCVVIDHLLKRHNDHRVLHRIKLLYPKISQNTIITAASCAVVDVPCPVHKSLHIQHISPLLDHSWEFLTFISARLLLLAGFWCCCCCYHKTAFAEKKSVKEILSGQKLLWWFTMLTFHLINTSLITAATHNKQFPLGYSTVFWAIILALTPVMQFPDFKSQTNKSAKVFSKH